MKDLAKIEEIYHLALEHPKGEREALLKRLCENNDELFHEVTSLLASYESAGNFFEQTPEDLAADFFSGTAHGNLVGKELGHYQILRQLGTGGMGEVYLAEDTKLGRKIALKILPPQFSQDAERKIRFEQEARAISALNHPNIITIHGIEKSDEVNFITTEYIEGQTLKEKIAEKSLTWQETVKIGIQIADALEEAHSVEIIHRDIKPANIMIRQNGIVKVLDFGLAKLAESKEVEFENKSLFQDSSNRITKSQNTNTGTILGTINYMSPEQALGKEVDRRTDIFSFGVVLYEMLTGLRPFDGVSDAAVYTATLEHNPPAPSEINAEIPEDFDKIILRAIEKKREKRYQNISELKLDLKNLSENSNANLSVKTKFNFLKLAIPLAIIILLTATIFFLMRDRQTEQTPITSNFSFSQLTTQNGEYLFPNLAPDGRSFLYSNHESGNWDVYLKKIDENKSRNLTQNSSFNDIQAVFSPDGKQIAFRSERNGGGIFVMNSDGGNVKQITDVGFYPNWSPDGKEIVFCKSSFENPKNLYVWNSSIIKINLETGERKEIYSENSFQPNWSPNGKRIAFWAADKGGKRDIKTISRNGGEAVAVTDDDIVDWNPVWSPDGKYLYFASERGGSMNFWRVAIDEETGKVTGNVEPFTTPSTYSGNLSFARDGKTFTYAQETTSSNLFQAAFDEKTEKINQDPLELIPGRKIDRNPSVSPDGEWIAFDGIRDKQEDLFVIKRDGTDLRQLTNDIYKDRAPRWSPDGANLIFYTNRSGKYESWTIKPDGSDLRQITSDATKVGQLSFWSPDGKRILQNIGGSEPQIFDADEVKNLQVLPENNPDFWGMAFDWSSDGDKIAFIRNSKNTDDFGVDFYSLSARKFKTVATSGGSPLWLKDNRRLIYIEGNRIFLFDTATERKKEIMSFPSYRELQGISISRDNRFIYFSLINRESDIWMAKAQ